VFGEPDYILSVRVPQIALAFENRERWIVPEWMPIHWKMDVTN
jgi:hypothetical protein